MTHKEIITELAWRNPVIILIGQSGAGKNTLAQPLLETGLFFHSETGWLFRENIPKFTEKNKKVLKKINDSGARQSWTIATALWVQNFLNLYEGGPILIDGSPRSKDEAKAILDFFGKGYLDKEIILLYPKVSDATAEQRMIKRNKEIKRVGGTVRKDTATKKARMKKLAFFHTDVVPAIKYLKNKGIPVYEINAEVPVESVRKQFFEIVEKHISKK